jgi:hypothetical protein
MQRELLMKQDAEHRADHDLQQRRGIKLLGVAGGAALAVLLVALGTRPAEEGGSERVDTAPAAVMAPVARVAALDEGVDWRRVAHAEVEPGASVAAYEPQGVAP